MLHLCGYIGVVEETIAYPYPILPRVMGQQVLFAESFIQAKTNSEVDLRQNRIGEFS